ncbi:MAG: lipocalin family protein [Flavobacteriaceae bacterium]
MKKNIALLFLTAFLIFSCSSDSSDDTDTPEGDTLVGTWVLTDLTVDSTVDDDDLDFAKEILLFLQAENCDLITFTFDESGTLMSDSKINNLSINVGVGGLDVPCPTESDEEGSLWVLEGDQLTISREGEDDQVITIQLDENTLIIPGESVDANNYAGADAVFTKQ